MLLTMKYFKHTTGIMFMAMATSVNVIPYNPDFMPATNDIVAISETPTLEQEDEKTPTPDETGDSEEEKDGSDETPEPIELPTLFINAFNPGYNLNDQKESTEFIELRKSTTDDLDLTGIVLLYTNTKGKTTPIYEFPEGAIMTGEKILLRYYKSPEHEQSNDVYKTSLALTGTSLKLAQNETILDQVCWNGKDDCYPTFKSANPSSLVRDLTDLSFESKTLAQYEPQFSPETPVLVLPQPEETDPDNEATKADPPATTKKAPRCQGLAFSEILTYYEESSDEQFIELYNSTDHEIELDECAIKYKNKRHALVGVIPANGYYAFYPEDFTLTKNPTKSNSLELIDADNTVLEKLTYEHGQKKSTSYARFPDNRWLITYNPTPNAANEFQEFRICEEGKVINPTTGNCVKASTAATKKALADCPEGKYRNPLTGRCKNIETSTTSPKECKEGYERNPDTGRCRKIKNTNQGAEYPLVPETYGEQKTFIALGAVGLVVLAGVGYIIWQYRREIGRALRKIRNRLH